MLNMCYQLNNRILRSNRCLVSLFFVSSLLLSGCGGNIDVDSEIATGVAKELDISRLATSAAGGRENNENVEGQEVNDASQLEISQATSIPTIAQVSVSIATNCRTGPGASFSQATVIEANQFVEAIGVPADASISDYVVIRGPSGVGSCWLWLEHADRKDFTAFNLPGISTPPKPTATSTPKPTKKPAPSFDWNGTWDFRVSGSEFSGISITHNGSSISGAYLDITFSASLSNNFQRANGSWQSTVNGASGSFAWEMRTGNPDQFAGSVENPTVLDANGVPIQNEWCGARSGTSLPSPCLGP